MIQRNAKKIIKWNEKLKNVETGGYGKQNHVALHHLSLLHSQAIKPNWGYWVQIWHLSVENPNQIQTKKQQGMTEPCGCRWICPWCYPTLSVFRDTSETVLLPEAAATKPARTMNCNLQRRGWLLPVVCWNIRYCKSRERMQTKWLRMLRAVWEKSWVLLEYICFLLQQKVFAQS